MLLSLWWWRPSTKCFSWSHSSAVFSWIDCWVESMRCAFHGYPVFPRKNQPQLFFPFGLPVRWMILHLWIRKSTEICFRSRPWRPWVSWVLETRRFCCIGCESNVRKVYIFREANMNHKNNSYLRISTFQYICLWQWQAKTTAQLRVAWCIFTWFSDVGIDFKMYPCIDMQQRQECSDVEALGITFSRGLSITRCC